MTYDKSYYEKNQDALRAYQRDYYYRSKYSNEPKKRKKNNSPIIESEAASVAICSVARALLRPTRAA